MNRMKRILVLAFLGTLLGVALGFPLRSTKAQGPMGNGEDLLEGLANDAFLPPVTIGEKLRVAQSSSPAPGFYQTSEFMIGRVAVGIILPESDGGIDPSTEDWTEDERALVLSEITNALNWWVVREPGAYLSFIIDDGTVASVTTSYEPIAHSINNQGLWIGEVMKKKGYDAFHFGPSYFDQVYHYNNDLREAYNADWAFTIFVVDSSNDGDNGFPDGYFAYAYLGGPFTVMTYGNNGYGPQNIEVVAAHEIGHIFWALDQYCPGGEPCSRKSGYLGVENQNSRRADDGSCSGCSLNVPSIMRDVTYSYRHGYIDEYAQGQIGWRDSDGDRILDPVDTTPIVRDITVITGTEVITVTGKAFDVPFPPAFLPPCTINTIKRVQYCIAGGEWMDAEPTDGTFDSPEEEFIFLTKSLDFEARALNTAPEPVPRWIIFLPFVARGGG